MTINQNAKVLLAIIALVGSILFGVNYMVDKSPDQSWIMWFVVLLVLAILFWLWYQRDKVAEEAAREGDEAADAAQALAARTEAKAEVQAVSTETPAVAQQVAEVVQKAEPEVVEETPAAEESPPAPAAPAKDDGEPDDLKKVEGIGPHYEKLLNAAGIKTFAALAALSNDEVVALIKEQGGRKHASMPSWAEQAGLAAKGDWAALEKLQDELTGGRK